MLQRAFSTLEHITVCAECKVTKKKRRTNGAELIIEHLFPSESTLPNAGRGGSRQLQLYDHISPEMKKL